MDAQFSKMEVQGKNIFLNGTRVRGVEKFKVTLSSDIPEGKAELEMKLIVEFPDNKQRQHRKRMRKRMTSQKNYRVLQAPGTLRMEAEGN